MKLKRIVYITIISVFWAGMIAGISFLEAPVKFTAPSLTLPTGLDVGRHVFGVFNKVELVLGTLLALLLFVGNAAPKLWLIGAGVLVLLLLESFWLLPVLDERALLIIAGKTPEGPSPHSWYVAFEALKLSGLITIGIWSMLFLRQQTVID